MTADQIVGQIDRLIDECYIERNGSIEHANPAKLKNNLMVVRGLLVKLSPIISDADKEARLNKAVKFDELMKAGEKKSPAYDSLKVNPDLIELESAASRIANYAKYVDGWCTSVQSTLKQTLAEANSTL